MSSTPVAIDVDGYHITGIATESAVEHLPLVVALHGGSYTSAYFDVPGHSLLEAGQANGFGVIALDRPCYGGSDPLPEGQVTFERNAEILDSAIAQLWTTRGGERPGVVVIGHSIGAAIAVHLAARRPAWPLLGIALSGIHDKAPVHVRTPGIPCRPVSRSCSLPISAGCSSTARTGPSRTTSSRGRGLGGADPARRTSRGGRGLAA